MSIDIKKSLTNFSLSDFFHDFSFTGDDLKEIKENLLKSQPINSKLSSVAYKTAVLNLLPKINNIYDFFKNNYKTLLPQDSDGDAFKEDILLREYIGFDYVGIRNKLMQVDVTKGILPENIPISVGIKGGVSENYELRCFPTKICGTYYNIPQAFENVTKTHKFVIIIDASFLSLTGIRLEETLKNTYIGNYDKNQQYVFYILQNNENLSDSATKIANFDKENENIKIYFLRDESDKKTTYLAFNDKLQSLYSKINLETKNIDGNINAVLKYGEKSIERNNLGDISQINRASFLALQNYVEDSKFNEECLSYFLLKRAGDWCQALSLLDTKREYVIYNEDNSRSNKKTTLEELNKDHTIGIITHDRILLGYSLLMGLNVFYSLKTVTTCSPKVKSVGVKSTKKKVKEDGKSIIWLVYFQNTKNEIKISDYKEILAHEDSNTEKIQTCEDTTTLVKTQVLTKLDNLFKDLEGPNITKENINNYILDIRSYLSFLTIIDDDFETKKEKLTKIYKDIKDTKYKDAKLNNETKKELSAKLYEIRSLMSSITMINERNTSAALKYKYDEYTIDSELLNKLSSGTISKDERKELNEEFESMLLSIQKDIAILKIKHINISSFLDTIPSRLTTAKKRDVGNYYIQTAALIRSHKSGGSLVKAEPAEQYRNDAQGNFYSLIDNKIYTHINDFKTSIPNKTYENCSLEEKYMFNRFLIYYLDELYTRLFSLEGEIPREGREMQFEDELYNNFSNIYLQLLNIHHYSKDIKSIENIYFIQRHRWTETYIRGSVLRIERYKNLGNFKGILKRIHAYLSSLKKFIIKEINNVSMKKRTRKNTKKKLTFAQRLANLVDTRKVRSKTHAKAKAKTVKKAKKVN